MNKQEKLKILLRGCSSCIYDEDGGSLFRHCTKCQFEISKLAYELVIDDQKPLKEPGFSNGLTKAQEEMFQLVEEECAELIQAISKVRRHGADHVCPDSTAPYHVNLTEECGDVIACIAMLSHNKLIDIEVVNGVARHKLGRLRVPNNGRVRFITPEMIP